ncbi:protein of unknown function [Rhizobiales bacterium GAS191]|nr:protein of unknown function [Rhizobiales bacterium GAS191]
MTRTGLVFLTAGLMLTASPALACKGKNVIFSDDFRQVDDTWGSSGDGDAVTIENGKVKIKATASRNYKVLYGAAQFDDADICVTVQIPNNSTPTTSAGAGMMFWAQDYANFYAVVLRTDGRAAVVRQVKGNWTYPVQFRQAEKINTHPGDKNIVRVTTIGNTVSVSINDAKFASFKGLVPPGGGEIGLYAESEQGQRDTWKFADLKVTDLPQ